MGPYDQGQDVESIWTQLQAEVRQAMIGAAGRDDFPQWEQEQELWWAKGCPS